MFLCFPELTPGWGTGGGEREDGAEEREQPGPTTLATGVHIGTCLLLGKGREGSRGSVGGGGRLSEWFCHTTSTVTDSLTFGNQALTQMRTWERNGKMHYLPLCCVVPARMPEMGRPPQPPPTWARFYPLLMGSLSTLVGKICFGTARKVTKPLTFLRVRPDIGVWGS